MGGMMDDSNRLPNEIQPQVSQPPSEVPPPAPPTPIPSTPKSSSKYKLLAIILVLVIVAAGAIYYVLSRKQTRTETPTSLKIGILLPFSGDSNPTGFSELHGIQLAQKQLGASNVTFVRADSKCDPSSAPAAMQSLVDQGVVAVIGEACSGASIAALPIANKNKIPMISPSATSPELSIPNDYFFRDVPPDGVQGTFAAKTMHDDGYKKVALLYSDEAYGNGLTKIFKEQFTKLGGTVVADEAVDQNAIDMATQVKAIKNARPDAVYLVQVNNAPAVAALKQLHDAGVSAQLFGSDAFYSQDIVNDAQGAAEGLLVTSFPSGTQAFKQAFVNAYQTQNNYAAAEAYDAFWALYLAIQKGATTGEAIKNELPNISFTGVTGRIQFDQNGEISDPSYKYDLLKVKGGTFITAQ